MNHTTALGGVFDTEELTFYFIVTKCMSRNKTLGKSDAVAIAHVNIGLDSKKKTVCSVCIGAQAAQTRSMRGYNGNSLP